MCPATKFYFLLPLVVSLFLAPLAVAETFTVADALRQTLEHHPRLRLLEAERIRLQGEVARARQWVPENPELAGAWTNRDGQGDTTNDWELSLSQRVEIAGQRGHRVDGAERRLDLLDGSLAALRVEVAASVHRAYAALAIAHARVGLAAEMVLLNDRLVAISRARLASGDVAEVDVALANLARSEALRRDLLEKRRMADARNAFASALGVERLPAVELVPMVPPLSPFALDELEEQVANHPRLAALSGEEAAVQADLALARASRLPDLTVSAHVGEEEGSDTLVGVALSLPIPLFHRHQEEVGRARARGVGLAAEVERVRGELWQEVTRAHSVLNTSLQELDLFATTILPGLDTHLRRILRAYELGEMDLTTLTVTQAQVVEARFDHLQVLLDAWQARIDLDRALGRDPVAMDEIKTRVGSVSSPREGVNPSPTGSSRSVGASP